MAGLHDLPRLAATISKDLAAVGIPHAVSGAAAMATHGVVRATKDLDILVVTPQIRLPEVFSVVRAHGFAGDDAALLEGMRERGFAELTSGPVRVEIFLPALPFHRALPDRAVPVEIDGVRVPFVTAEDLIVLKVLWCRPKDVPDVHSLIAAAGIDLDERYVRRTLAGILPADDPRHALLAQWLDTFRPPHA